MTGLPSFSDSLLLAARRTPFLSRAEPLTNTAACSAARASNGQTQQRVQRCSSLAHRAVRGRRVDIVRTRHLPRARRARAQSRARYKHSPER